MTDFTNPTADDDAEEETLPMDFEDRLSDQLRRLGDGIQAPPTVPGAITSLADERRRRRRSGGGLLVAAALAVGGLGAYSVISESDDDQEVVAADGGETASLNEADEPVGDRGADAPGATLPADTGPELVWTEIDGAANAPHGEITWNGSSFIGINYTEDGSAVTRSSDGVSWSPLGNLPAMDVHGVRGSGQAIVAWGTDPFQWEDGGDVTPNDFPDSRVVLSTDDGSTWTDLGAPATSVGPPQSPYLYSSTNVSSVATNGEVVVAIMSTWVEPNIEEILADNGIDYDPNAGYGYGTTSGDGSEGGEIFVCNDQNCSDEISYSFEELGLSPEDSDYFNGGESSEIFRFVDGAWEPATLSSVQGYGNSIVAAEGSFVLATMGEQGSAIYRSSDGRDWEQVSAAVEIQMLSSDGSTIYGQGWGETGSELIASSDGGRTWTDVTLGVSQVDQVIAGSGGLAVTGQLYDATGMESFDEPRILEKDGYIITWMDDSLTVADAASGEIILAYGPEEMSSGEAPDTVIEADSENDFSLTFLDPETFEPLVTLDENDMNEAFDIGPTGPNDNYEEPENFIGWSGDGGATWGWQTSTEAFGANGWTQLIVGEDRVIAIFQEWITDYPSEADEAAEAIEVDSSGEEAPDGTTATTEATEAYATTMVEGYEEPITRIFAAEIG